MVIEGASFTSSRRWWWADEEEDEVEVRQILVRVSFVEHLVGRPSTQRYSTSLPSIRKSFVIPPKCITRIMAFCGTIPFTSDQEDALRLPWWLSERKGEWNLEISKGVSCCWLREALKLGFVKVLPSIITRRFKRNRIILEYRRVEHLLKSFLEKL